MTILRFGFLAVFCLVFGALVLPSMAKAQNLASHRALYDVVLTSTHSGSQILNISGEMAYEWRSTCGAYVTDHHFKLLYEYADAPSMNISSDFSTFESQDGGKLNFASRRKRNGEMFQEIRGIADVGAKKSLAVYSQPKDVKFDLANGTLFPTGHSIELIKRAIKGDKFFNAQIFDGSDEAGPIEINAFIGQKVPAPKSLSDNKKIDQDLLAGKAWNIRMAVFPASEQEEESDYEMSMVFHDNGIISDMNIDYDGFSVRQSLVALEKIPAETCDTSPEALKKP